MSKFWVKAHKQKLLWPLNVSLIGARNGESIELGVKIQSPDPNFCVIETSAEQRVWTPHFVSPYFLWSMLREDWGIIGVQERYIKSRWGKKKGKNLFSIPIVQEVGSDVSTKWKHFQ
jgi:hypothetical protein